MQLYLILFVIGYVLAKFKELFAGVEIPDSVKKFIKFSLVALALYCVYKIVTRLVNKQNALGDDNGQIAIELHNAIYSQATNVHIWFFGDYHIGNGDEAAVLAVSQRIKDITQVSAFYKDLFDIDLFEDLSKILSPEELAQFNANVKSVKGGSVSDVRDEPVPTPAGSPVTPPVVVNPVQTPVPAFVAIGTKMYCKSVKKVNVRSSKDPQKIIYTIDSNEFSINGNGYVGDFVSRRFVKIAGKDIPFIEVDIPWILQGASYGLNGLISEGYLTTVKPAVKVPTKKK